MSKETSLIIKAAIRYKGKIYTGRRHNEIINEIIETHGLSPPIHGEQGFVDENDNFLDRISAAQVALKCGQIKKLIAPPRLFSEDLY